MNTWLMATDKYLALVAKYRVAMEHGHWPNRKEMAEFIGEQQTRAKGSGTRIGLLPIFGVIQQRMSEEAYFYGMGFPTEFGIAAIQSMVANPDIGSIVLEIDSPGGIAHGTGEFADVVHQATKTKPVYAMINSLCCSAAYWIATAATKIIATPGADTGSVGVYNMHEDISALLSRIGVKIELIHAGKYKTEGNPYQPLTEEGRASLQDQVNVVYDRFVTAIARYRNLSSQAVRTKYGEGRSLKAPQALQAGMIDQIATLQELMDQLSRNHSTSQRGMRATEMRTLQLRQVQRKRRLVAGGV
jgi:signal peptide peptidase SppA